MIVAIDGPAAAGKGTVARRLAEALGYVYLDTGALYRAVGKAVLDAGGDPDDAAAAADAARRLDPTRLDGADMRTERVGDAAGRVAALPEVRAALLDLQRRIAARPPGAVLDGRDTGTVICPEAECKLFVTASLEERAGRRLAELRARGEDCIFEDVLAGLAARDARDRDRDVAPLRPAADAVWIDTTGKGPDEVFRQALSLARRRLAASRGDAGSSERQD